MNRNNRLITNYGMKTPISEAYRSIRTNIQFSLPKGELKSMIITSSTPSEGKSITTVNIAITMAETDRKVLLIDADLRKSTLHRVFHIPNIQGLTNVLAEDINPLDLIRDTGIENLDILTSGPTPPNPSELLGSSSMKNLLDTLENEYDLIMIDTPPVLAVTDATLLGSIVDGVVLITSYGVATHDGVEETKARLENVGAKILGAIINSVPINKNSQHYYYYYSDEEMPTNKRAERKRK